MTPEAVLTFNKDGTAHGLYTEAISLHALGRLSVQRASTIEFDNSTQEWVVRSPSGAELFRDPVRRRCLDWERDYFNNRKEEHAIRRDDTDP